MKKGASHAVTLILVAILIMIGVGVAVYATTMYNPSVPISQHKGECAMRGIQLEEYTRSAESARDASRYIKVRYNHQPVSPCTVNGNFSLVYESCFLGKYNNIKLEVNPGQCNMVDLNMTEELTEE